MLDKGVLEKARQWLSPSFDEETRKKVKELIENDPKELTESFYRDLEFGTGGLRGIMGVGTNRMNRYTVGMATQGLSNYLKKHFAQLPEIRAAIAYDSRNNSPLFAEIASKVLSANGIKVYIFDSLRPTPELSFAIRTFKCHCGIVITASHNPKEYNGYKVYWEDGGQIVPPHDKGIIEEVKAINNIEQVNFKGNEKLIVPIGKEIDEIYLNTLSTLSLSPEVIRQYSELPIVYTPIHGTGVNLVPMALKKFGFKNVITVEEQCKIDGNFPTVASPNPEERTAMQLAIEKAKAYYAEIAMATDPDSDRVGIGVRKPNGDYVLLNGNQAASILIYYILNKWHEHNKISGNEFLVKTIVTTDLISAIAHDFGVDCYEVLTGFKYIAEKIREQEGVKKFIAGGEESYGYLYGDFVRDKDAVLSCAMFAEITAWAKSKDKTLLDILYEIYTKYGLYKEHLVSLTRKGIDGLAEIKSIMEKFRSNPPKEIGSSKVVTIIDYLNQVSINVHTGKEYPINLPKSDVMQFITENGTKVSVRPSGTEPKIKFYISVKGQLDEGEDIDTAFTRLDKSIENIVTELNLK
ncbi:phospho-sugar mutase [Tenuifilum thalassicum]|uniref:Phospho-sugar mutase n=1 Tax=Tenuifilum thalassicum TaxID=2590900 RepID=A0A7D3XGR8_9BACT|nr:phospho-sugar mutase [Tenuifilum thalassicum]QKG80197.1 phospho-sugar mutase [Tenuifilum thalassicum]